MIKLTCSICNYSYSVSEEELLDNSQYHQVCILCGAKLFIENLDEIVNEDLYKRAEKHLAKWVTEIGWDNTIDLIKRNKKQVCYRIYKELLEKKGFKINEI